MVVTAVAVQVLRSKASVERASGQSITFAVDCEQQDLPWAASAHHHVASAVAFIVDNMLFVIVFLFAFVQWWCWAVGQVIDSGKGMLSMMNNEGCSLFAVYFCSAVQVKQTLWVTLCVGLCRHGHGAGRRVHLTRR